MITTVCKISYGSQTVPPIVPAVQGDTGRAISFEIADFTPPAGATATYFILKPSGEAIYNSATITDNSILCELTAQSLAEAGENRMQVRVLQGENIVTSFEVILMVRTFLGDDAMESGTEMNIFDQAVAQATEQFQENAEQIVAEVIESIPADYTELNEEVDELNERFGTVDDVLPKTETMEDITSSIQWTTGKFIDAESGTVYSYADSAYGIVGNVKQGDTFNVTNARGIGSSRAITLISSAGIVNDHCTVLSYYPSNAGYYDGEYTVPEDGILIVGSNSNYSPVTVKKRIYQYEDVPAKEYVDNTLEEINSLISQFPKINVETDITDTIDWTTGKFIDAESGTVYSYADSAYGIVGNVKQGDTFVVTNARGVGSWRAITLISSAGIVNDHCTVLSYYPSNAGYYDGEYIVPADGILVIGSNSNYSGVKVKKITEEYAIETSPLMDVKWYSIGDSLNEFNSTAETNWIKYMIYATGADNTNVAQSGSGFYRGSPLDGYTQTNYIKQLESVGSDAELITIAGSFNDLMSSPWPALPVGSANDTGNNSIAGYMNAFFDALISNFPTTAIAVVMTSPWDVFKPGATNSDAYVSVLKVICEKHGIPFYSDCYYGCNLRPWNAANKTEYYTHSNNTVDGVHPNSKGHVFIYRMLRPFLEKVVHVAK